MPRLIHVTTFSSGASLLLVALLSSRVTGGGDVRLIGYSASQSAAQLENESRFASKISAREIEKHFDLHTAEPHHTGSSYDAKLADYVAERWKAYGLQVARYEYSALIPWPGERSVQVVSPEPVTLHLEEEILPGDPFASKAGILPAYNAYSPSGDVTGELVYVNYGVPADYEMLDKLGISVKGKIALVRYGGSWRGIKPKVAAEHGAIGCLIYSDPREDGYFRGDVYPAGAYRGWGMVQRGSVIDMPVYPGDPLTPNQPSKAGVPRVAASQVTIFPRIPVHPLAPRDGLELLKRLSGPVAPEAWRGALPLTYHVGPGPAKVRIRLRMDYAQRPLINVVGTIRGSVEPDEWVITGVHRDAWTFGASDSGGSHASMMEIARVFGELKSNGWRPRRSIMFVSWDGEEQGLQGSTEWVEDLAADLHSKAVVYINRDGGTARGWFDASAVHSLTPFIHELARAVNDPLDRKKTLYDRWLERARSQTTTSAGDTPLQAPKVGALGSGSDYTAFLDHIGVASMNIGIVDETAAGTYHSTYDHPGWFKKFIDPDFTYTVASTKVSGLAVMRFADAEVLPFDYESYGNQIVEYVDDIQKEATAASATDIKRVDFAGLRQAAQQLAQAGARVKTSTASLLTDGRSAASLKAINQRLVRGERELLAPAGLPDRPWFRHTIYAPGLYTGYSVKTIPGVREAVDAKNFDRAAEQARVVIAALQRAAAALDGSKNSELGSQK